MKLIATNHVGADALVRPVERSSTGKFPHYRTTEGGCPHAIPPPALTCFHATPKMADHKHDRPNYLVLPRDREARWWRDGRSLQSRRHAPPSVRCAEVPSCRCHPRPY